MFARLFALLSGEWGKPGASGIEVCAELFAAIKTRSALLAVEHVREDAVNKAEVLEWIDERRYEGDIVLVDNNPLDAVGLIRLSEASYRRMQENLVWATGDNVFALPLAAGILAPIGVLLSPATGAVLMSLSTIIVVINARRLGNVDLSVSA